MLCHQNVSCLDNPSVQLTLQLHTELPALKVLPNHSKSSFGSHSSLQYQPWIVCPPCSFAGTPSCCPLVTCEDKQISGGTGHQCRSLWHRDVQQGTGSKYLLISPCFSHLDHSEVAFPSHSCVLCCSSLGRSCARVQAVHLAWRWGVHVPPSFR